MRMLHDPTVRQSIETRLKSLRPDSPRLWGTMTPDQMLWHLNQFMGYALGEEKSPPPRGKMPKALLRFFLLNMPWPKSAPTLEGARATERHDFETERQRLLSAIDRFAKRPLEGSWPIDPLCGEVTGPYTSKLQAKHIDHHFRQFGA